jgi:serine O-acetyltransferase
LIVGNAPRTPVAQQQLADALWTRLRLEAKEAYRNAPMLAPLFVDSILNQPSFEAAIFHRISARLSNNVVGLGVTVDAFNRAVEEVPDIADALRADIAAVVDRDPACEHFIEPFLYFKGFHAIQTHRLANWLWKAGERNFAPYLQGRSSDVFQTDIHPAVSIGRGIFLDHATGLAVGETSVIEDDVSMLHGVTLGGTGKQSGGPSPEGAQRRNYQCRRQGAWQYRSRRIIAHRRWFRRASSGAGQCHGCRCPSQGSQDQQRGRDS